MLVWRISLVALLPLGCAASDGASTPDQQEIREGAIDERHAEVGLFIKGTSPECTGTLIARNVVLTAAHCLPMIRGGAFYLGKGSPSRWEEREDGVDPVVQTGGRRKLEIADALAAPGYRESSACPDPMSDVGLVRLRSRAPSSITPARWAARAPDVGEVCTAVGFGAHPVRNHVYEYGVRRQADVKLERAGEMTLSFADETGGTEAGDSGAPVFCGGAIVGVNSCGNRPDHFARLDKVRDFIEQTLADWRD